MTKGWQELNSFLFETDQVRGTKRYNLYLSPYDVPEAVRSLQSESHVALEFKYIPVNESLTHVTEPELNNIKFEVGEKTGRVYKIIISKPLIDCEVEISIKASDLDNAFDHLAEKLGSRAKDKYDATKQATRNYLMSHSAYV